MSISFSRFDQYKLRTEFSAGYYKHTISYETDTGKEERTETWSRGRNLGRGAFGTVWLEKEEKGALRAVKQIHRGDISNTRELLALTKLSMYPQHFVQFFGWFENDDSIYFSMEYIPCGDLGSLIEDEMTESEVKTITKQLLKGLKVMHEINFCHRDLKPQNILVVSHFPLAVKISDFGISKQTGDDTALRTAAGTTPYTAPEVFGYLSSETSVYTSAVDIWSLGCLIHTMITKELLFPDIPKLFQYIQSASFPKQKLQGKNATSAAIKFIASLTLLRPEKRLTAEQALKHPWLNIERQIEKEESTFWTEFPEPMDLKLQQDSILSTDWDMEKFHECITLNCAFKHENLRALRRLCQENKAPQKQFETDTLLYRAACICNKEMVKLLLEEGANATTKDPLYQMTALHEAAQQGERGIAKILLESGADINAMNSDGYTALHLAADEGRQTMVAFLVEKGADITVKSGAELFTALHLAIIKGQESVAKLLLEKGAEIAAKSGAELLTALHLAVIKKQESMVKLFLENGADTATKNNDGETALHLATKMGQDNLVVLLLEKGANIEGKADAERYTALHLAARVGHRNVAELLSKRGADTTAKTTKGFTALHLAALFGHRGTAISLLDNGADIHEKDGSGFFTALHFAAQKGHVAVVKALLENGADIVARMETGYTPLQMAVGFKQERVVSLLRESGACGSESQPPMLEVAAGAGHEYVVEQLLENEVNVATKYGVSYHTALYRAAYNGHAGVVKLLLASGAKILKKTRGEDAALFLAAQRGHDDVMRVLLEKNANMESKFGEQGHTALHEAVRYKHVGVVKLLLKKGADPTARDTLGFTALYMATDQGRGDMVNLLLQNRARLAKKSRRSAAPHYTENFWHKSVAKALLEIGGDTVAAEDDLDMIHTTLYLAVKERQETLVRLLLKNGADPIASTALDLALSRGYKEIVMLLRRSVDALKGVEKGHKVPYWAVNHGRENMVKLLLEEGVDCTTIKFTGGNTALHLAVSRGNHALAKLLLEWGANCTTKSADGNTALHLAASQGNSALVELLLNNQASIDEKNEKGFTPLHFAVKMGECMVAAILRGIKADISGKNNEGDTMLHTAIKINDPQKREILMKLLIRSGAELDTKNRKGRTPRELALDLGHKNSVELLDRPSGMAFQWRKFKIKYL